MRNIKYFVYFLSMFVLSNSQIANALMVEDDYVVKINQIFTYNSLSNGDVILYFTVVNPNGQNLTCTSGVYMRETDPGMQRVLSVALAARASGSNVVIQADKDPATRWPSGSNICHLIGLKF